MIGPDLSAGSASAPGANDAQRNARYAYLVGRLRNRQMTMEEATELFALMQGMLRQSELARAALMRTPPPPPSTLTELARPRPPPGPPSGGSDDFFLLGLLAMGAGAGLLAALTKRVQDLTPPASPTNGERSGAGASTR